MRDPDVTSQVPDLDDSSVLDAIPGLAEVARLMADAVAVTDLHRRVVVWNDAAAELYGIAADQAVGRPVDALLDSAVIGATGPSAGVRAIALQQGSWRGRLADRPLVGRLAGDELIVEVVLSRLDTADGRPVGVLSVKREVTAGVRLEQDLATLGSLVSATGETRTRTTVAERAIDVIAASLGTSFSMIAGRRPRRCLRAARPRPRPRRRTIDPRLPRQGPASPRLCARRRREWCGGDGAWRRATMWRSCAITRWPG